MQVLKALQKEIAGLKQKLDTANTAAEAAASTEAAQKADTQSAAEKLQRRILYLEQNQTQLLRVPRPSFPLPRAHKRSL